MYIRPALRVRRVSFRFTQATWPISPLTLKNLNLTTGKDIMKIKEAITWTHVNNDYYGHPRYVTHFLNIVPDLQGLGISNAYEIAVKRANKLGGRKFHNQQYGGGVVFASHNLRALEERIALLIEEETRALNTCYA